MTSDSESSQRDLLTQMLERQLTFQQSLGFDFTTMSITERVQYVRDMVQAATAELHEALDETSWKPWAKGEPFLYVHQFCSELVDVLCFVFNMWLVANHDLTPEQLATVIHTVYTGKVSLNHQRQRDGYDGRAKCPQCRRALDDPGIECEVSDGGYHCAKTGTTYLNDTRS